MEDFDRKLFLQCCREAIFYSIDSNDSLGDSEKIKLIESFSDISDLDVLCYVFEDDYIGDPEYFLSEAEYIINNKSYIYEDKYSAYRDAKKRENILKRKIELEKRGDYFNFRSKTGKTKEFEISDLPSNMKNLYKISRQHKIKAAETETEIKKLRVKKSGAFPLFKGRIQKKIDDLEKKREYHHKIEKRMLNQFDNILASKGVFKKIALKTHETITGLLKAIASRKGLMTIGSLALAAAIFYIARKAYKKYEAKKAGCEHLKGESRDKCIRDVKTEAIDIEIANLKRGLEACDNSSDPIKCRKTIQKKIVKLTKKKWKLLKPHMF